MLIISCSPRMREIQMVFYFWLRVFSTFLAVILPPVFMWGTIGWVYQVKDENLRQQRWCLYYLATAVVFTGSVLYIKFLYEGHQADIQKKRAIDLKILICDIGKEQPAEPATEEAAKEAPEGAAEVAEVFVEA